MLGKVQSMKLFVERCGDKMEASGFLDDANWFWCSSEGTLTCVWQPAPIWLDTRVYNTPLKTTRWTNIPQYADNFESLQGGALVTLLSPLWIIFGGWMGPRWVPGAGKEGRQDSFLGITGEHITCGAFCGQLMTIVNILYF